MGISVLNQPATSGGKILKKVTLTSGSSWTVPSGVTDINVTLYGAGGGGGASGSMGGTYGYSNGGTGGTTTFTGATSAGGGNGGTSVASQANVSQTSYHPDGNNGSMHGEGGLAGGYGGAMNDTVTNILNTFGVNGSFGKVVSSTLSVTPGQSIGYSIGGGGARGQAGKAHTNQFVYGGYGADGKIDIEYWV